MRVCLDTAHSLAAGYELRTPEGLESDDRRASSARSACHGSRSSTSNDSKVDLGRNVDRHDNIGQGKLGLEAFARILTHPRLRDLPFVLEVPGYDGEGPDAIERRGPETPGRGRDPALPTEAATPPRRESRLPSTAPRPS